MIMQSFSNWDLALGSCIGSSRVLDLVLFTVSSVKESVHAKSLIFPHVSGKTFLKRSFKLSFFLPRCYCFIFKFSIEMIPFWGQ